MGNPAETVFQKKVTSMFRADPVMTIENNLVFFLKLCQGTTWEF